MADTPTFPAKLAAALVKVSSEVKQLGKSEKNAFAKYDFVSVDKFYAVVGNLMAANGVHCIPDCVESRVVENMKTGKPLLRERWAFTLIHETGEMAGPFHRTVTVPAEGAQAHGSSESYAQKQFLRGVFRVPTGEKDDADYGDKPEHAAAAVNAPAKKLSVQTEDQKDWTDVISRPGGITERNAAQSREAFKMLADCITFCAVPEDLKTWAEDNKAEIYSLSAEGRHHLRDKFDNKMEDMIAERSAA
jgi:hypothetical protein